MKKRLRALLLPLLLFVVAATAHAQSDAAKEKNQKDSEGWESVNTQMVMPGEGYKASNLVAVAYGFIWVMVAGFVFAVWRRTEAVERETQALRKRIEQASGKK